MLAAAKTQASICALHWVGIISSSIILQQIQLFPCLLQQPLIAEGALNPSLRSKDLGCRPLMKPSWTKDVHMENVICATECITHPEQKIVDQHSMDPNEGTKPSGSSGSSSHQPMLRTYSSSSSEHTDIPFAPSGSSSSLQQYDVLICTRSTSSSKSHEQHKLTRHSSSVDLGSINFATPKYYSTVIFRDFEDLTIVARGQAQAGVRRKTWRFLQVKRVTFVAATAGQAYDYYPLQYYFAPKQSMVIENTAEVIFASQASLILESLSMTNVTVDGFALSFSRNIKTITFWNTYFVDISCAVPSSPHFRPEVEDADVTIADSNVGVFRKCSLEHQLNMNSLTFLNVKISALRGEAFSSFALTRLEFKNCQIEYILSYAFSGVRVSRSFVFIANTMQRVAANAFYRLVARKQGNSRVTVMPAAQPSILQVHGNSFTYCECNTLSHFSSSDVSPQQWTWRTQSLHSLLLNTSVCMANYQDHHGTSPSTSKQSPRSFLCSSCQRTTDVKDGELSCNDFNDDDESPDTEEYSTNETICSCEDGQLMAMPSPPDEEATEWKCKDGLQQGRVIPFEHYRQNHCQLGRSSALAIVLPILAVILVGGIAGAVHYYTNKENGQRQPAVKVIVSPQDPITDDDEHYANADSLFSSSTGHTQPDTATAGANPEASSLGNTYEQIQDDEDAVERYETPHHRQTADETVPSPSTMLDSSVAVEISTGPVVAYHVSPSSGLMASNEDLYEYVDITRMSHQLYESASVQGSTAVIYDVPAEDNADESETSNYEEVAVTNHAV